MKMPKNILLLCGIISVLSVGCYTKLMLPEEFAKTRGVHSVTYNSDATSSLSYNRNCLSCHSPAELDDRYLDMKSYGITTAHGIYLDPGLWVAVDVPTIYNPGPDPRPGPPPTQPWWIPTATIVQPTENKTPDRVRDNGTTRDGKPGRERPEPVTTYTPPAPPPPVVNTPLAPATVVVPQKTETPPPSSSTDSDRSRSSDTNSSRERDNGTTRDNGRSR